MKKILGIIILGLLWCNVGFAEIRLIETKHIKTKLLLGGSFTVNTLCVDGYKFVMSKGGSGATSRSMVQFFEERDGKSLPAKC
jgi:hypothetical protein